MPKERACKLCGFVPQLASSTDTDNTYVVLCRHCWRVGDNNFAAFSSLTREQAVVMLTSSSNHWVQSKKHLGKGVFLMWRFVYLSSASSAGGAGLGSSCGA